MNTVNLIGRLTNDVELKMTNGNKKVTRVTVAVARDKETADFVPVVAWEKTAELLNNYCSKGSKIAVVGRLQTYNYEDQQGNKRFAMEVVAERIEFCEGKKKEEQPKPNYQVNDDDLPF